LVSHKKYYSQADGTKILNIAQFVCGTSPMYKLKINQ